MNAHRSPVHRLVQAHVEAFDRLGISVSPSDIERMAFMVHHTVSSGTREFHTHEHVLELAQDPDPIGMLAALYHDLVYVQVDLGIPPALVEALSPLIEPAEGGWRILPAAAQPQLADTLAIFGRQIGDILGPYTGVNELASAFVAALYLGPHLERRHLLAVSACIEATIPFRREVGATLARRLRDLGLSPNETDHVVHLALRVANADVKNFASEDIVYFLDKTWKLLPETNPALHRPRTTLIGDYRRAIQKMEAFLRHLPPENVYHQWEGEPSDAEHARRIAATAHNLSLTTRYLRQKLYSSAILEALAHATGGDVPLDYVMGGFSAPGSPAPPRIESFLPTLPTIPVDDELQRLLADGRAEHSRFDTPKSPLAAFLHASLGEARIEQGFLDAQRWWAGETSAEAFLGAQPAVTTAAIAEAAAHIADTRGDALRGLAQTLRDAA